MNCRSCGAHYKAIDLQCPYCGKVNTMGALWLGEKNRAEKAYLDKKTFVKKSLPLYLTNNIINAVCLIGAALIVLLLCGLLGAVAVENIQIALSQRKFDTEAVQRMLEEGDYRGISEYFEETEYLNRSSENLSQAKKDKMYPIFQIGVFCQKLTELDKEVLSIPIAIKGSDDYVIRFAVSDIVDDVIELSNFKFTLYKDYYEENVGLYKLVENQSHVVLIGVLGCTEDEAELLTDKEVPLKEKNELKEKIESRMIESNVEGGQE